MVIVHNYDDESTSLPFDSIKRKKNGGGKIKRAIQRVISNETKPWLSRKNRVFDGQNVWSTSRLIPARRDEISRATTQFHRPVEIKMTAKATSGRAKIVAAPRRRRNFKLVSVLAAKRREWRLGWKPSVDPPIPLIPNNPRGINKQLVYTYIYIYIASWLSHRTRFTYRARSLQRYWGVTLSALWEIRNDEVTDGR